MAVPLEEFIKRLEESGVVSDDTIRDFVPPRASPKGAEELAYELVRSNKLTKYQAAVVYSGNNRPLILGNYVIMEKIGSGGMGQVFKARHKRMDRVVAVKLLSAAIAKNSDSVSRFEREVKAAAKISHPNVVAAHDADCADGTHFLVMEFVEGSDLSSLVKKNGPLPLESAADYTMQAAMGLEAAHKKGIVHRDIKPSNLLLNAEGTVKILDMGLASLKLDEDDGPSSGNCELTTTGKIMGTVDFMSPEQALNTHTADERTDIYALGCTLYYLLTGKAMYTGNSPMEKLLAHRLRPIPSLSSAGSEVPEQLDAIYRKMVAKRVSDRYQSATDVIADFCNCGFGQGRKQNFTQVISSPSDVDFFDLESSVQVLNDSSSGRVTSTTRKQGKKSLSGKAHSKPLSQKSKSKRSATKNQNQSSQARKLWLPIIIGTCSFGILVLLAGLVLRFGTSNHRGNASSQMADESATSNRAASDSAQKQTVPKVPQTKVFSVEQ